MGLDVYQMFTLGVRLEDHAKFEFDSRFNCTGVELWNGTRMNYRDVTDWLDGHIGFAIPTEYIEDAVIGLAVDVDDEYVNVVPAVTQEMIDKAKAMLSDIGIHTEPKLYAVVRISY